MKPSLTILGSGSSGNSWLIEHDGSSIMIDAGLSARELERRMLISDHDPSTISGLILTHGHMDHTRGSEILSTRWNIPVYTTSATARRLHRLNRENWTNIDGLDSIRIDGILMTLFPVSHDASDTIGIVITIDDTRLGMATDLGAIFEEQKNHLRGCNWLILEFNHDSEMLDHGPYPAFLKHRIRSDMGHLSNRQAGAALEHLASPELRGVVLAHISETNNRPELAVKSAQAALGSVGCESVRIIAAPQTGPTDRIPLGIPVTCAL